MKLNDIEDIMVIGFQQGLKAGIMIGQKRVLDACEELHIHNEHGAIVYLEELNDHLGLDHDHEETELP